MKPSRRRDPVVYVTTSQIARMASEAARHPRGRINHDFHEPRDPYQRMLSVVQPGSYVRPHRHRDPPKAETFVVLRGEMAFFAFADDGTVIEAVRIGPRQETLLVDLKPGVWHSVAALAPDTAIFEGKNGPYDPATDKEFAPWAPEEGDPEAAAYLAALLARLT